MAAKIGKIRNPEFEIPNYFLFPAYPAPFFCRFSRRIVHYEF